MPQKKVEEVDYPLLSNKDGTEFKLTCLFTHDDPEDNIIEVWKKEPDEEVALELAQEHDTKFHAKKFKERGK